MNNPNINWVELCKGDVEDILDEGGVDITEFSDDDVFNYVFPTLRKDFTPALIRSVITQIRKENPCKH